jgi:alpha-tubulin suppressor-like RCC1 family protein
MARASRLSLVSCGVLSAVAGGGHAGGHHAGVVYAWGRTSPSSWFASNQSTAMPVANLSAAPFSDDGAGVSEVRLAAGGAHSVIARGGGTLVTFGGNTYAQLGIPAASLTATIAATSLPTFASASSASLLAGSGAVDLIATSSSVPSSGCVDGTAYDLFCAAVGMQGCSDAGCIPAASSNWSVGSRLRSTAPAQLSAGHAHTLLRTAHGQVWGWGRNLEGQLGVPGVLGEVSAPQQLAMVQEAEGASWPPRSGVGLAAYVAAGHFKSAVVVGGTLNVSVVSEGRDDVWAGGGAAPPYFGLRASVHLNGVEVFPLAALRGHVVVVIDQHTGQALSHRVYNTHDAAATDANQMASELGQLPAGRVVVVATAESAHTHIGVVAAALRGLGALRPGAAGAAGSWVLVGRVGYSSEDEPWVVQRWRASGLGPTELHTTVPLAGAPGPTAVYTAGQNEFGELGLGSTSTFPTGVEVPGGAASGAGGWRRASVLSALGEPIAAVEFGRDHAVILSGGGQIWGLGSGEHWADLCVSPGSAAGSPGSCYTAVPVRARGALAGVTITAVATGTYHTLALGVLTGGGGGGGELFCVGANSHGECGLGHTEPVPQFTRVSGAPRLKAIAAGSHHSLALSTTGAVLGWGWGASGQLGATASAAQPSMLDQPRVLPFPDAATAIAAGDHVSLAAL